MDTIAWKYEESFDVSSEGPSLVFEFGFKLDMAIYKYISKLYTIYYKKY
jgi:hypothetical protein